MEFKHDQHLNTEYRELSRHLEEVLSDASHRELGGFGTTDGRFAHEVVEVLRDVMGFLDRFDTVTEDLVRNMQSDIDERDDEIQRNDVKFAEIADWVADHTRLSRVTEIINQDDTGY